MTFQCWKWVHHWRSTMTPGGRTGLDLGRPLRPCAGHGVSRLGGGEATKSWGFTSNETLEQSGTLQKWCFWKNPLFMGSEFFLFHVECRKPLFILLEAACAQYGSHLSARDQDIPSQTSFFWFQTGIRWYIMFFGYKDVFGVDTSTSIFFPHHTKHNIIGLFLQNQTDR